MYAKNIRGNSIRRSSVKNVRGQFISSSVLYTVRAHTSTHLEQFLNFITIHLFPQTALTKSLKRKRTRRMYVEIVREECTWPL
jgi:hypothetical protein